MSSIKNQKIGGDASVGRNVAMGGNGRIAGSLIIGHNLQVKGWLEAPNIKDTNKGVFASVESLSAAYPSPRDGWFAGVGESTPFDLYVAEGGAWAATGGELNVEVDIDYYNGEIERIDGDIHDLTDDVSANSEAIGQHDGLIAGHTQQIAEITETLTEVQQTATAAKEQSESNADSIGEHTEQLTSLSSTVSANSQSIAVHAQQIEQISGTLAETRGTADEAKYQSNANAVNISRVNALVGYYECSTAPSVSAKTITANSFSRIVGGCMHVKMHFANTASSATLNINGTGAIALYYNGKHVSARNTWEDDEIVVVFFDGDEYQAFPVGAKYIEQQSQPQPSQPADFPELDELEERVGSLERAAGQHNVLPFDSELPLLVTPSDTLYEHTIQPRESFEYSICLISLLGSVRFCLKVGNDYYNSWSIKKQFSSDGLIPVGQGSIGDPYSVPTGTYTEEISNNDWYSGELHNKVFYNRSNKVVYAYNCETKSLEAMTNIQVVEENAPADESTSNPNNSTKGSIVVDLENDKLLTWDGNKWKALSGGGSTPVDVPNSIAIRNRVLYLEKVSTGSEPVVFASVELPAGGGQTVVVQSSEDSPSIVRLNTDTSKLGKKVIPLGTSAANLFKNGIRENDSDVYDNTTYSSDDGTYTVYHIKYEFDLNNSSVTVPEKSILKFEGGCLKNGTLVGNNTKVEVDGTYTIFDNMSFSGTFRDSSLYATNFGAVGDMTSVTYESLHNGNAFSYKEKTIEGVKVRTGSDNTQAFKSIRDFLNYSNNITITFNGAFYLGPTDGTAPSSQYFNQLTVNEANNITFKGGTSIAGWYFVGCNDVTIDGCNFVGFHEKHDFPNITSRPIISVDGGAAQYYGSRTGETFDNAFILFAGNGDKASDMGCSLGIYFVSRASYNPKVGDERTVTAARPAETITEAEFSKGMIVKNCHFEMLNVGVYLGMTNKSKWDLNMVNNCVIENCTFDHIVTQALSLHARNSIFRDIDINYAWMPIDLSSGSALCVFENTRVKAFGMGFKQEQEAGIEELEGVDFFCGGHIFKNIDMDMDNTFPYLGLFNQSSSPTIDGVTHNYRYVGAVDFFAFKLNQGTPGNKFRSKFTMPEPSANVTYTVNLIKRGTTVTWSTASQYTLQNVKTATEEATALVNYINNNPKQFKVYATSSGAEVTIRANDDVDYDITFGNALSEITASIERIPNAVADVAKFEDCTFRCSRAETAVNLKKDGVNWKYDTGWDDYRAGCIIYTFIQCAAPAIFSGCKFEFNRAQFFLRDTKSVTAWLRPYTFNNCDINIFGRVTENIFYNSYAVFNKCRIKYAGLFLEGETKYPKGKSGGSIFQSNANHLEFKNSDIEIDYGTTIVLPVGSKFINNRLLYKNPETCIISYLGDIKVNDNDITCTLDGLTDTELSNSSSIISTFFIRKNLGFDSPDNEINGNKINTRSSLLYVESVNIPNFSFKRNNVIISNLQDNGISVMQEGTYAVGQLLKPNNGIEIYDNIITGTATWRLLPDIIRSVNGSYVNNDKTAVFRDNLINTTFKNNLDSYYIDVNYANLATYTKVSNNKLDNSSGVSANLSESDKGLRVLTADNILSVWNGNAWSRVEAPLYGSSTDIPSSAQLGATYFDTTNNVMKVYNGSQWVDSEQRIVPSITIGSYIESPAKDLAGNTIVRAQNDDIRMKLVSNGNDYRNLSLDENECMTVNIGSGLLSNFNNTVANNLGFYYATDKNRYYVCFNDGTSNNNDGIYAIPVKNVALSSGTFNNAPDINEVVLGYTYYDTVRQKLLTAKSEGWTDNEGNVITVLTKGTTAQRPATTDITEGFKYYNTETHKEQIYNGTTWIDIEDAASAGTRVESLVPDVVTGSALSTTLAAAINKYYRYDTAVDTLTVTLPELVSSAKVQNVVVYLTAGSNADSTTITFAAATPTEGTAAPVYYQKSYDIEAGKTYEINALYNGAAWIIAAVEIVTAVAQSSNSNNNSNSNSLLMGGFTPADTNLGDTASTDVQPENTEDI